MGELRAQSAFDNGLPLRIGTVVLEEAVLGALTSLSPVGDASALSTAVKQAHGVALPGPNRALGDNGCRCIWFGRNERLLVGPDPEKTLSRHAAVVDVSDAWAAVALSGSSAVDVLARLVPIDLRKERFGQGHTARTLIGHMNASITCAGEDRFLILVFRSMARSLAHDFERAMEGVASRG